MSPGTKTVPGAPGPEIGKGLVEGGDGGAFAAAAMEIVHGDVNVNFAAGRFDAEDHGFGINAARKPFLVHVDFRRKYLEADDLVAFGKFGPGKLAGNAHGNVGSEIEDHTAFDVTLDGYESGHTLAAIG